MTLSRFVEKWTSPEYPPDCVSEAALCEAEEQLGFRFPADYVQDVLEIGLPHPNARLLDAIAERGLDDACPDGFNTPEEIVTATQEYRGAGMPSDLVVIALDVGGNAFCFLTQQITAEQRGIWLFDHNFMTVKEIAPSFRAWINALCAIEPLSQR